MVVSSNLGFPRIGANRELKKLVESYWASKINATALLSGAANIRASHWELQREKGISHIPSNDFSFYDQVLDHIVLFGIEPEKYRGIPNALDRYFAMGRGLQRAAEGIDVPAMEMKKWFDTNYHFIVPEVSADQTFTLSNPAKPVVEFLEAKEKGIITRPVILGPVTFLWLSKPAKGQSAFNQLSLLDKLVPVYEKLLGDLRDAGASWIQLDEPALSMDLGSDFSAPYASAYARLSAISGIKIIVANYFGRIGANIDIVAKLPVQAIHADLVRAPEELDTVIEVAKKNNLQLSLGVVNGRNIWKVDLDAAIAKVQNAVAALGSDNVLVAPSCSLLHTPHSLTAETKMSKEILEWLAFSSEKLSEIATIVGVVRGSPSAEVTEALEANRRANQKRKLSLLIHDPAVQSELSAVSDSMFRRESPFESRIRKQQAHLKLPAFPTTTVGSFPQTKEVRLARQKLKSGEWDEATYTKFIQDETTKCIKIQEDIGLDVLVHGEFERNDMVEYFGEQLRGYVFSQNGWVQSYGSRCVKPPIIYGDVSRPTPMTVDWAKFSQSKTTKPMKGMLTGPVTCLQWSFVRDDQPRRDTAWQLALAIRKEVQDLEKAGISVIQIDEPAIREGLPLRSTDWAEYLDWAAKAFLLSSTGVKDETQIHTHMCYSDFNDIFETIQKLDADVITIENSKSDLKLLHAFEKYAYTNGIGPGLYDIHSPRVPSTEEMADRLEQMLKYIKADLLWVNPDCGLKTRGWPETEKALTHMVEVAKRVRNKISETA
ncbi:cobalamin-independent methionine synthase [Gonapodya prolifera JEL478]|uniref:5-methyltetrahydropteroyltriglutamate--homocysteine S-methyltransferase n=1 Tax=Gonapodya prolifera (strain JEL478) TaxID=1344416 RepID=A0A139ARA1_GONPJ|nr:cobalamin-independent methionine synthase [Gonapodya prolifera JEL478]|eukprot:KXS19259.1 cobalamin-independent methionine synthase [Gonapodya prolifera JEL478]